MTFPNTDPRGTLKYRLPSSSMSKAESDPGLWGHEYIRHLAAELGMDSEYLARKEEEEKEEKEERTETIDNLHALATDCAKFLLLHNAEPDAEDLLEKLEIANRLVGLVDSNNMLGCAAICLGPFTFKDFLQEALMTG